MRPRRDSTQRRSASVPTPPAAPSERTLIGELDEFELDLLAVLALCSEPISRTQWAELAGARALTSSTGKTLVAKDLEDVCARLSELGLVKALEINRSRTSWAMGVSTAMEVLEVAHERDRLTRFRSPLGRTRDYRDTALHGSIGNLRMAVVRDEQAGLREALDRTYLRDGHELGAWLLAALGPTPKAAWIERVRIVEMRDAYLRALVRSESRALRPVVEPVIEHALALADKPLHFAVARVLVLRGEPARARKIAGLPKWGAEGLALLEAFWAGDFASALEIGERAFAGRKQRPLPELEGVCHLIAAIVESSSNPRWVDAVGRQIRALSEVRGQVLGLMLEPAYERLIGGEVSVRPRSPDPRERIEWSEAFVRVLHDVWLRPALRTRLGADDHEGPAGQARELARSWQARAEAGGYPAIAREFAAMIAELGGKSTPGRIASAFHPPEPWEAALASLEASVVPRETGEAKPAARELLWEVIAIGRSVEICPRLRASPRAKKGNAVTLARLSSGEFDDMLSEADRRVLACVTTGTNPWETGFGRPSLPRTALLALVGHPRVIDSEGRPRKIERGRVVIRTRNERGLTMVELEPADLREQAVALRFQPPDRFVVYERTRELEALASVLAREQGLAVPIAGRERLARTLAQLSTIAAVEVEGDLQVDAREVEADPRVVVQLGWNGDALAVRARVAPLGMSGPILIPGQGAVQLVGDRRKGESSELLRCTRDLADERRRCDALLDACPTLAGFAEGELQWRASSLHDALEIVLELDALADQIVLAWHAGQKLGVPKRVDASELRIKVGKGKSWFDVEVSLDVDEHALLRYRELLRGREGPRFVALPRGQFLALSDQLRRHLDRLASLGLEQGEGLRVAPAVLPLLEELAAETVDPSFDAGTLARLEQLREIATLVPKLPRGFAATLRDYQREGFVWMARLAEAGLGACLADDMGLGKTIQALALLAHRARRGPALVVCPTSVVSNWIAEARRFAPSLRFVALATADDRGATLASAGARTVVVCSYKLLVSEIERLAELELATVVFDEAHALKNSRTQRATAARRVRAEFRLALTGTPIENHLGELWSLFAAILPGVLGSETAFEERFVGAREDRERRNRLRTILRPFVLRRLKSQVLDELPPRTEITLEVEPYPEQRAFYEAMRRAAVERTARLDPKKARFHLLSEITRLRQAAVDPRLIEPEVGPKGAKLDVLIDRLVELREEGHRALVFTQFLGSLAAVRERMIAEGIEHFELEGSTPASERARRIDAFQAGEGDVFLLSLRAGGVGVNLTGADYVFHLDPWWNPAVEDQASDRAHRIGQARPVTIYRLVTAGTIEEKILALHGSKRELADDLLAGLERSEVLDVEQLRALLAD
ncbi:SNF2-related protein [Nannocystaceae bacterium ST9]